MATHCTMNLLLVMAVLMAFCQIISFGIPGWLVIESDTYKDGYFANYAVWYVTICSHTRYRTNNENCMTESYLKLSESDKNNLKFAGIVEWELELTIALMACLLTLYLVCKQRTANQQFLSGQSTEPITKTRYCIAVICSGVSSSLVFVPVSKFAKINTAYARTTYIYTSSYSVGLPYGLVFAAIGGSLAGILSLIQLVLLCSRQEQASGEVLTTQQGGQPQQMIPLMPVQGGYAHAQSAQPLYPGYHPYPVEQQAAQYHQQPGGPVQYHSQYPVQGYAGGYYPTQGQDGTKVPLGDDRVQQMHQAPPAYKETM